MRGNDFNSPTQIAAFSAETGNFQKAFTPAGSLGHSGFADDYAVDD